MINEERNIIFSNEALCVAFELEICGKDRAAAVTAVTPNPDASCAVMLERDGDSSAKTFSDKQVLAIIVRFARHIGMPLPRRAPKSLFGMDDRLVMQMSMTTPITRGATAKLAYLNAARRRQIA